MKRILSILLALSLFLNSTVYALTPQFLCASGGNMSGSVWVLTTGAQAACTGGTTYTNTDTAVLNSTSGQLTVTTNQTAAGMDMTGYANTLTVNSGVTLTMSAGDIFNIQGGFAGTGIIATGTGGVTLLATPTGSVFPTLNLTAAQTITSGGFSWPGNVNLTATATYTTSGALTILGALTNGLGVSPTISGANNVSVGTLQLTANSSGASAFIFPASQTLTVTSALKILGTYPISTAIEQMTIKSGTTSTSFNLNYSGTVTNANVSGGVFTDVNASGSTQAISNWFGGTLTRSTNINNVTGSSIGGGSSGYAC